MTLPERQQRRRDEDRGVGAGGDADQQREREVLQRRATEQRAASAIGKSVISDVFSERVSVSQIETLTICANEFLPQQRRVLAHAVEHDDRVVERVAEDRQHRGDGCRRHHPPRQRVHADRDDDVVEQRDDRRQRVLELEPERQVRRRSGTSRRRPRRARRCRIVRPNDAETDFESNSCVFSVLSMAMPNFESSAASTFVDRRRRQRLGGRLDLVAPELVALRGRIRIAAALDDGVLAQAAVDVRQHVEDLLLARGLHERRLDRGAALEVDPEVQAPRHERAQRDQDDDGGDREPEVLAARDVGAPAHLLARGAHAAPRR